MEKQKYYITTAIAYTSFIAQADKYMPVSSERLSR